VTGFRLPAAHRLSLMVRLVHCLQTASGNSRDDMQVAPGILRQTGDSPDYSVGLVPVTAQLAACRTARVWCSAEEGAWFPTVIFRACNSVSFIKSLTCYGSGPGPNPEIIQIIAQFGRFKLQSQNLFEVRLNVKPVRVVDAVSCGPDRVAGLRRGGDAFKQSRLVAVSGRCVHRMAESVVTVGRLRLLMLLALSS
jgi:hypothetical protein